MILNDDTACFQCGWPADRPASHVYILATATTWILDVAYAVRSTYSAS